MKPRMVPIPAGSRYVEQANTALYFETAGNIRIGASGQSRGYSGHVEYSMPGLSPNLQPEQRRAAILAALEGMFTANAERTARRYRCPVQAVFIIDDQPRGFLQILFDWLFRGIGIRRTTVPAEKLATLLEMELLIARIPVKSARWPTASAPPETALDDLNPCTLELVCFNLAQHLPTDLVRRSMA